MVLNGHLSPQVYQTGEQEHSVSINYHRSGFNCEYLLIANCEFF